MALAEVVKTKMIQLGDKLVEDALTSKIGAVIIIQLDPSGALTLEWSGINQYAVLGTLVMAQSQVMNSVRKA